MTQHLTTCQFQIDHPAGPHPGCAEFDGGATVTERCYDAATHVMRLHDEFPGGTGDSTLLVCAEHREFVLAHQDEFTTVTFEQRLVNEPYDEPEGDGTLGPCGCVDYHMADCDVRHGGSGMTADDYLAVYSSPGYDPYYDESDR